jgi:hypothetical protein
MISYKKFRSIELVFGEYPELEYLHEGLIQYLSNPLDYTWRNKYESITKTRDHVPILVDVSETERSKPVLIIQGLVTELGTAGLAVFRPRFESDLEVFPGLISMDEYSERFLLREIGREILPELEENLFDRIISDVFWWRFFIKKSSEGVIRGRLGAGILRLVEIRRFQQKRISFSQTVALNTQVKWEDWAIYSAAE